MKKSPVLSVACAALALCGVAAESRKVAVFAQNDSGEKALDGLVETAREQLAAVFADAEGFKVVQAKLESDDFKNPTNAARKAGCDFVAVTTFEKADFAQNESGGTVNNVFSLTLSLAVRNAKGAAVDGIPSWTGRYSFTGAGLSPAESYLQVLEEWKGEVEILVATKAPDWPSSAASDGL